VPTTTPYVPTTTPYVPTTTPYVTTEPPFALFVDNDSFKPKYYNANGYTYAAFNYVGSCKIWFNKNIPELNYILVGGGGKGGMSSWFGNGGGAGGGGGAVAWGKLRYTANAKLDHTVGAGGSGNNPNGGISMFYKTIAKGGLGGAGGNNRYDNPGEKGGLGGEFQRSNDNFSMYSAAVYISEGGGSGGTGGDGKQSQSSGGIAGPTIPDDQLNGDLPTNIMVKFNGKYLYGGGGGGGGNMGSCPAGVYSGNCHEIVGGGGLDKQNTFLKLGDYVSGKSNTGQGGGGGGNSASGESKNYPGADGGSGVLILYYSSSIK
jgi:hypothetical protein